MHLYLMPVDKGRPIVIDKAVMFIGRHPECDLVITDSRKVSRKHCCVAVVENRLVLRDLGSMNGVRVNGRRVRKEATLRVGDEVKIGDVAFLVRDATSVAQSPPGGERRPKRDTEQLPERPVIRRPVPVDLSQEYPVAIPDESMAPEFRLSARQGVSSGSDSGDEALALSDSGEH